MAKIKSIFRREKGLIGAVDDMSGVGAMIFDRGQITGLKKFVGVIQKYMNNHDVDAETACDELGVEYADYKSACDMISSEE